MRRFHRLKSHGPYGPVKRVLVVIMILTSLLLCGFSFGSSVLFPINDAVDTDLIEGFGGIVDVEDLAAYLDEPLMAEQIVSGVTANLAGNVYQFELPEFRDETLGGRIVGIILDRLFS